MNRNDSWKPEGLRKATTPQITIGLHILTNDQLNTLRGIVRTELQILQQMPRPDNPDAKHALVKRFVRVNDLDKLLQNPDDE